MAAMSPRKLSPFKYHGYMATRPPVPRLPKCDSSGNTPFAGSPKSRRLRPVGSVSVRRRSGPFEGPADAKHRLCLWSLTTPRYANRPPPSAKAASPYRVVDHTRLATTDGWPFFCRLQPRLEIVKFWHTNRKLLLQAAFTLSSRGRVRTHWPQLEGRFCAVVRSNERSSQEQSGCLPAWRFGVKRPGSARERWMSPRTVAEDRLNRGSRLPGTIVSRYVPHVGSAAAFQ